MPRYVIDTNAINDQILKQYIEDNPHNIAIIPYEVMFEAVATGTVEQYLEQFNFLYQHANQVEVLHPFKYAAGLDSNLPNMSQRMIDRVQTISFRQNASEILNHGPFYDEIVNYIRQNKVEPSKFRVRSQKRANENLFILKEFKSNFTDAEMKTISRYKKITGEFAEKIYAFVENQTIEFYIRSGIAAAGPRNRPAMMNNWPYRQTMISIHHLMELIGRGGERRSAAKTHNDLYDHIVSTFATYFDGMITRDKAMVVPHMSARLILASNGGDVPLLNPSRIVVGV